MIIEFYPNPNAKKKVPYSPPAVVIGSPPTTPSSYTTGVGIHPNLYEFWARKKNLTVEEFVRRDKIVREMYKKVTYKKGDTVYPYIKSEYEKRGRCYIKGVYKTYAEMEGEWPGNDIPFIVTAHPMLAPKRS